MTQGGRIAYIDVARGIAIIAIVAGHLEFSGADGIDWVSRFVFLFHVPVFFVITGYFLSAKKPFGEFLKQKTFRMMAPYVFTCLVMLVILAALYLFTGKTQPPAIYPNIREFAIAALYGAGTPGVLKPEGIMHIGAIWFLEALLVAIVIVRASMPLKKYAVIPVVAIAIAGIVSARYFWLPLNLQSGAMGALYVYLGHLLRTKDFFNRPFSLSLFAVLTLVVVESFAMGVNISIVRAYCGPWALGIPVAMASSVWCIMLAQLVSSKASAATRFLSFYGKNSLVVLCVHLVCLNMGLKHLLLNAGITTEYNALFFVNLVLQLALTALCALAIQRMPHLRKLFY